MKRSPEGAATTILKEIEYGVVYGRFHHLGVLFVDVFTIRALLFGVYIRAPDFGNLPCKEHMRVVSKVIKVPEYEAHTHNHSCDT